METPLSVFSHCQMCQQKLQHTALFCPKCGRSNCSWECYLRHMMAHKSETSAGLGRARSGRASGVRQVAVGTLQNTAAGG